MAGRKSKFTDKTRNKIYKAIRYGLGYKEAAQAAGVGKTTLHRWRATGKACSEAESIDEVISQFKLKNEDEFWEFWEFWERLEQAEPMGEYARAARIAKVGRGGYKTTEERVTTRDAITPLGAVVTLNEKTVITRKVKPDWKADAWVLERRSPERWGRRESKHFHEVIGALDHKHEHKITYDFDKLTAGEIDRFEQLIDQLPRIEGGFDLSELGEDDQQWLESISKRLSIA